MSAIQLDEGVHSLMKRLRSVFDVSVTLLVAVAAALVIWRHAGTPPARPTVEEASGTIPADLATEVRGIGPVALVEFSDFECPYCGRHAREVGPMIRKAFVDTGVVREIFVNYPLANHANAVPASEAALCAGNQGKFWEMHDALFQNQSALTMVDLTDRAGALGLDTARFSACVGGGETRRVIERHQAAGRTLGVKSTPAFFLGTVRPDGSVALKTRLNGALPFDEFRSALLGLTPNELRSRVRAAALGEPILLRQFVSRDLAVTAQRQFIQALTAVVGPLRGTP